MATQELPGPSGLTLTVDGVSYAIHRHEFTNDGTATLYGRGAFDDIPMLSTEAKLESPNWSAKVLMLRVDYFPGEWSWRLQVGLGQTTLKEPSVNDANYLNRLMGMSVHEAMAVQGMMGQPLPGKVSADVKAAQSVDQATAALDAYVSKMPTKDQLLYQEIRDQILSTLKSGMGPADTQGVFDELKRVREETEATEEAAEAAAKKKEELFLDTDSERTFF